MADEVIQHVDPDGVVTDLAVAWDVSGRYGVTVRLDEQGVPGQPGLLLRDVQHGARDISLSLWINAPTPAELQARLRDLVHRMDPRRGDSVLRMTGPAGDTREITVRVVAGLDVAERLGDTSGPTTQRMPIMCRAYDPYWAAGSDIVQQFQRGEAPKFFPFFPLRLASSEIWADVTVTNPGDVDAWPVWTIVGPGSHPVIRNETTGKVLDLAVDLGGGESVTIDTRPRRKEVTRSDGTSAFGRLSWGSSFWPLAPGTNAISIEMGSAVSADSRVVLSYRPRYLSM
ncbi:phage distal tail protein [Goodfellowiella coeruleoviolacea]|uniref:Phage tail protein n=1 Tax=Goodfellowiella coeruleoviolacea TaxID=334858 RepID=A0AAE3GH38_9PSEU|nr:phage tail domain-containing protein [Goodfellowiella coeruleoviolacea]MCP2168137.1 Phage tail protein [Goodfellowiella coeruleoviolacea]